ncbi:NAD(P)-binding protein [Tothia fuscella]|uniref:NAD(P)-binding protein n=1 Tax=Tothia fuscella TaxID=1048955 RepID=A0A9P4NKM7_9PEZI|nr:NAD(P)-binding protein [Tothia fuscella]
MSRPEHVRTSSTNLLAGAGSRQLEGKLAIVTGASRGIGEAIARNLASKGASLVLNYTSQTSASKTEDLAKELQEQYHISTVVVQADLGSEGGPAHIITIAKNHFAHPKTGKFQIDILINNAGVSSNNEIAKVNAQDFARQYNVNVRGPLFLIKEAKPYLPTDRSGRIVNLSSVSSALGFVGQSVYGGTKAALEAMTRTWSRELSENCTVNAVNPGPVATDMYDGTSADFQARMNPFIKNTPLARARKGVDSDEIVDSVEATGGRAAYADEIAGCVSMLCSPESAWCTGSVICANGGMRMSP